MTLFGIELRRPTFNQVTSATVLAVGLWVALVGFCNASRIEMSMLEAAAALGVLLWSCIAVQLGVHVGRSKRHLMFNVAVNSLLLAAFQGAAWAFAG